MPFDENLILIDGSVSLTAATAGSFAEADSTTRDDTSGAAVIDISKTRAEGLAAVLICPTTEDTNDADYILGFIEVSDEEDFASDVHEVGKFDLAAATKGRLLASECPCTVVLRFATDKKYVRANLTPTSGGGTADFGAVKVLLSPYPFVHL